MLNLGYALPALAASPCCAAWEPASPAETLLAQSQRTSSACCSIFDGAAATTEILEPFSSALVERGDRFWLRQFPRARRRRLLPRSGGTPASKVLSLNSALPKLEGQLVSVQPKQNKRQQPRDQSGLSRCIRKSPRYPCPVGPAPYCITTTTPLESPCQ